MNLSHDQAFEEMSEYEEGVKNKELIAEKLLKEEEAGISAFMGSEEYEEIQALYFMDGFWYGDSLARKKYPTWDFNFETLLIPDEVSEPLSRALERENAESSHDEN